MKIVLTFVSLLLVWTSTATGSVELNVVHVGGDVPKPGPLRIAVEAPPTFDAVIREMGVDLTPFYQEETETQTKAPCPLRVQLYRNGQVMKTLIPSIDQKALTTERVLLNDTIVVRDLRKQPEKIEEQRKRIEKALELGSVQISQEIRAMADLQFEYNRWLLHDQRPEAEGKTAALRQEVARLCKEGKGAKIIQLLELDRSALVLSGLGPAHPVLRGTDELKRMFEKESVDK